MKLVCWEDVYGILPDFKDGTKLRDALVLTMVPCNSAHGGLWLWWSMGNMEQPVFHLVPLLRIHAGVSAVYESLSFAHLHWFSLKVSYPFPVVEIKDLLSKSWRILKKKNIICKSLQQ